MSTERKGNRLKGYDYSNSGYYYITICVDNMEKIFGRIENGIVELNEFGLIIKDCLHKIPSMFRSVQLDYYIIMPDHIHLILLLGHQNKYLSRRTLSGVIGTFKSQSSKKIHTRGLKDFYWKRSFYDRIIRNYRELILIRKYIEQNPLRAYINSRE